MAPSVRSSKSNLKALGILAAGALVVFAVGYGVAWYHMDDEVEKTEEQYQSKLNDKQAKLDEKKAALQQAEFRAQVLSAAQQLYLAASALEARNFGTADKHVEMAHDKMKGLSQTGEHSATIGEVESKLAAWEPAVTEDVGRQRQLIIELAKKLVPLTKP